MQHSDNTFRTLSINLAAYLLAQDFELLYKEPDIENPRRFFFVFRNRKNSKKLSTAFLTGRGGTVDVHKLLEAQKQLKQLLFDPHL